jgi:hypothetical protein
MTARLDVPLVATGSACVRDRRKQSSELLPEGASVWGEERSRRLLLLERTMYRDGLTPFTSVFTVSLRGDLNELGLRQALAQMQAMHPLLRCRVEVAADGPQFVEHREPAPVPLRIVERDSALDWEREARREWVTPFGSTQDPLLRGVWLRGKDLHELMLVAHHCICDGPSGIALLRDCFAAYDNPLRESDAYHSFGAMEDLVPEELLRDRAFRLRVYRRAALLKLALLAKVRRRHRAGPVPSAAEMYFHRWQLHTLEAGTLMVRCRVENVSVFAAAGVAILQAFREVRGVGALRHVYSMVNARRFLPGLHSNALFGIAPGVEIPIRGMPYEGGPSTAVFWERARAFRKDLMARMDRLGSRFYETLVALEGLHDRYPRLIADTDAAPAVRHITFSNLGKLDLPQQHRGFRVEHVYSPLVMVSPSPANTVVLSSFGGAIEFSIISDEHSLPQADAAEIQERAMAILRTSAGIVRRDGSDANRQTCLERTATR